MARLNRKDRGLFTYALSDGTLCYGVRVWRLGTPITKKGFRLKNEARQWYEDRRRDIRENRPFTSAPCQLTLGQLIADYLATIATKKNVRGEHEYGSHWKARLGKMPIQTVTALDIDHERAHLLQRPVSPATVNRYVAWLHHVYQWAIDRALANENPCRLFVRSAKKGGQRFTEKPAPDQVWTNEDLQRLSVELGEHILVPLLALLTGLRQDEQFGLRRDRIDWDRGCVMLDNPKAGVSQVAYLSQDALRVMRHQASKAGSSPFLYPSPRWPMEKPMNGKSWYALYFKPAAQRAGLTIGRKHGKTWHTLRHSFADRLLDLKVHLKDVQGAGRWESMAAMQRYLKKRQERVAAGVALLESPIALESVIGTDTKPTPMNSPTKQLAANSLKDKRRGAGAGRTDRS